MMDLGSHPTKNDGTGNPISASTTDEAPCFSGAKIAMHR